jgi:hypothetical protein
LVKLDAELSCHACQFKLQNVSKIIYQDLSGSKFATVFLAISRISAGVHRYYGGQIPKNSIKKAKFTQDRVEYKVFLFDEPLKGSKSPKIIKINLTFRFDKL